VNGVHDLGGMHGFGPVVREENEPAFHHDWERRTLALLLSVAAQFANIDEFRRAIERMAPAAYLSSTYYERWLFAVESLLVEKGVCTKAEIEVAIGRIREDGPATPGMLNPDAPSAADVRMTPAVPADPPPGRGAARRRNPRFRVGDRVVARNLNPQGHTRLPRYARGHCGVIRHDWGVFTFPDTHAHGGGANPQHCYAVEFAARELWGRDHPAREQVYIDLWEDYLEPEPARASKTAAKPLVKKATAPAKTKKLPVREAKRTKKKR